MKQVSSQTRDPQRTLAEAELDRENFHYVKIQKDSKDWESNIDEYLDKPSHTDPTKPMYVLATEDRRLTGSSRMVLLKCSIDDYVADQKIIVEAAQAKQRSVASDESFKVLTAN